MVGGLISGIEMHVVKAIVSTVGSALLISLKRTGKIMRCTIWQPN